MWIASLTLLVYQCESKSVNFTSFQSRWWLVLLTCSETAEVWVRTKRTSLSCSFILSHRLSRFTNVDFGTFTRNSVNYAVLSSWIDSVL